MAGNEHKSSHGPKVPKLRSACNQCNAGKVKCSGDRRGCTRCVGLGAECIYLESRVGKVQGVRAKRKKSQPENATQDDVARRRSETIRVQDEDQEEDDAEATDLPSPKRNALSTSLERALHDWSPEPWASETWGEETMPLDASMGIFNNVYDDIPATSWNQNGSKHRPVVLRTLDDDTSTSPSLPLSIDLSSTASVTTGETSLAGLDLDPLGNLSSMVHSPSSMLRPTPLPTTVPLPPAPTFSTSSISTMNMKAPTKPTEPMAQEVPRCTANMDSKCVLACTNIIITLENYLLSDLKVLDLILSTVRSVGNEVCKIVRYQQESRCDRCIFLFITIMSQIVALLEVGSKVTFEEEPLGHEGKSSLDEHLDFMPKSGFGALVISAEEQRSWKTHVIRRECRHAGEILMKILVLARLGPKGSPPATPSEIEDRSKCLKGIEQRLDALREKAGAYIV